MRKDEVVIRIITKLDETYGDIINLQDIRPVLDEILYDFDVIPKSTALVPINNMQDKIMYYLVSCKVSGLADKTIESYGRGLGKFMYDFAKNVEDITAMDIRIHLANYAKTGVKSSTIASRTDILRGFFGWLHNEEYIDKNPMNKIKTVKIEKSLREPLTYEEMEILRGGCKTLRQRSLLEFIYTTCLRLSEVESVDISDINWHKMQLNTVGKGNKERTVYFNVRAKIHLQRYLSSREDDNPALFVTKRKPISRLGKRAIQREISKIKEQSGLKRNVFCHLLRHSGASHMLDKDINIEIIQEILGHSSLDTTQIYAKTSKSNVEHQYRKSMNS